MNYRLANVCIIALGLLALLLTNLLFLCIIALGLLALLLTNLLFPSAIWADDKSCWLEASMEKVHVYVTEMDADGSGETTLWEGWIEQGDRQQIESTRGQIIFSYRMASEDRTLLVIEWLRRIELTEIILHFVVMETRLAFRNY